MLNNYQTVRTVIKL